MSVGLYYKACRLSPLSSSEEKALSELMSSYSKEKEIEKYIQEQRGLNWEDFSAYELDPESPEVIFSGSTNLPDNSTFAPYKGARHWVDCLNRIKREVLPDAEWSVSIDDNDLIWDEKFGWHDAASNGFASLWLGCLMTFPFRLFMRK
jgi:hypothetical protein